MDWLRWHHGTVNDPKLRAVARRAGQPVIAVIAVWAAMLECASIAVERGTLAGWDHEDVAVGLDMETEAVAAIYTAMQGKTLEGGRIMAWEKRQAKRERDDDTSTGRVREYRKRQKAAGTAKDVVETPASDQTGDETPGGDNGSHETTCNTHETPCNANSGDGTPQIRLDKIREEDTLPGVEGGAGGNGVAAAPPATRKRPPDGQRLGGDWRPSPEAWAWARDRAPDLDLEAEFEQFQNYWFGESGPKARKQDWDAAWRFWVGRSSRGNPGSPAPKPPPGPRPDHYGAPPSPVAEAMARRFSAVPPLIDRGPVIEVIPGDAP